jgi:hypothetical protein
VYVPDTAQEPAAQTAVGALTLVGQLLALSKNCKLLAHHHSPVCSLTIPHQTSAQTAFVLNRWQDKTKLRIKLISGTLQKNIFELKITKGSKDSMR